MKQSVSWWCYDETGLEPDALARLIAESGYQGVELLPEEHFALATDYGLRIVAINGHRPIEEGLNRREHFARIEAMYTEQIALAEKWDIPNLICFSGNRAGQDDATGAEITAEHLRQMASRAEDAGITLVLELLNSKVDHPDYQCDHTAWGVQVCQMVDSPAVKLLYDIYHMQIMEGDIIQTIRDYHAYFGHYHTAGVPGRNEIDESQELNYSPIARAIADTGYTGWLGQEFVPLGDPAAALRDAQARCRV
jgi:hydroxypyruvate isomerase